MAPTTVPAGVAAAIAQFDDATRDSIAAALWQTELDLEALDPETLETLASQRNSPSALGDRMARYLRYLIDHPLSHTPDLTRHYQRLLPYCDQLSPQQAYVIQSNLLGPPSTVGYDMVPTRADFEFPRDHLPKPRSQVGWHFFVGSCWDTDGREYGVELMFFQTALFPPPFAAGLGLDDDANQIVELQFAISEAGGRHFQAEPVVLAGTSGLISSDRTRLDYQLGRNRIHCHNDQEFWPVTMTAWGVDRGGPAPRELSVDITLSTGKGVLRQGADGCMPSVDGTGSLYYSIPGLHLEPAVSSLVLDGRTVQLERGEFWFDHQWGALSGTPSSRVMRASVFSSDPKPIGWDWFMTHLAGNRQITVFAPHDKPFAGFYEQTGPQPPGPMRVDVAGTYMAADCTTRMIRGALAVTDWIRASHSPNPQRYAVTDTWYPNRWEFAFGDDVPEDIRRFVLTPIVHEAQSGFFANGAQYAEGAVVITDPGGEQIGRGFAESVAYADTRATVHRLAGLPDSPEHVRSMSMRTIPKSLALANAAYVLRNRRELMRIIDDSAGLEFFVKQLQDRGQES